MLNEYDLAEALRPLDNLYQALIRRAELEKPKEIEVITLDLGTAQSKNSPRKVNFPFKSFRILSATDSNANVYFLPYGAAGDAGDVGAQFKVNGTFNSDVPLLEANFYWSEQTGKTMEIELYRNSTVTPGNFSTSISEVYSSFTQQDNVTVANTATLIAAADSDRKVLTVYNNSTTVTVWLGNSGATAGKGIPVLPGGYAELKNTAAIYGITSASTASVSSAVEK
jgi:hypothetical protein